MARSGGRLNRLLEFIGLVDDEPEDDMDRDRDRARSSGAQGYQPQQRRQAPPARQGGRVTDLEEARQQSQSRYASSARPDYDARSRARSSYASSARSDRGTPARSEQDRYAPRDTDSRAATRDYERNRDYPRDYERRTDYERTPSYRSDAAAPRAREAARDELEAEFEAPSRRQRAAAPERERAQNLAPARPQGRQQTVIYYLRSLEECRDVINDLIDGKTVLLNLEDMDERMVQRGIDTLCGAAFALNATLRKASDKTYLIAPNNVDVASTNDSERRL